MKRNLYIVFTLLFAATTQMSAQQMAVSLTTGEAISFEYDPSACKITFSGGQMLFHANGEVKNSYNIKEIQRIFFYGGAGNVDTMPHEQVITYSSATEELNINTQPGTSVAVYHLSGAQALCQLQTIASSTISVAHLPAGTYVVVAGSETLKFVKQ